MNSLRKKTLEGFFWAFIERVGLQGISFVISVILARLLTPEDFGIIALALVIINLLQVLVESGFNQALIRMQDAKQVDYSTAFFLNVGIAAFIYLLVYLGAPFLAKFYDMPILEDVVKVLGLLLLFNSFSTVQQAILTKNFKFKEYTILKLPSLLISGVVGVTMAIYDFGVWSLVVQQVLFSALFTTRLWLRSDWIPKLVFDFRVAREMYHYSFGLVVSAFINRLYKNIYTFIIGKYYSPSLLGLYNRANGTRQLPVKNISSVLMRVTFPVFAEIQDDNIQLKQAYSKLLKQITFVIFPIMLTFSIFSEELIMVVYGDKWLKAAPIFQILCLASLFYPINSYNLNILKVKGKTRLYLNIELIKKIIMTIGIVICLSLSFKALLILLVLMSLIEFFINGIAAGNEIQYRLVDQVLDLLPTIALSLFVATIVYVLKQHIQVSDLLMVISGSSISLFLYWLLAYFLKFNQLAEFKRIIFRK